MRLQILNSEKLNWQGYAIVPKGTVGKSSQRFTTGGTQTAKKNGESEERRVAEITASSLGIPICSSKNFRVKRLLGSDPRRTLIRETSSETKEGKKPKKSMY